MYHTTFYNPLLVWVIFDNQEILIVVADSPGTRIRLMLEYVASIFQNEIAESKGLNMNDKRVDKRVSRKSQRVNASVRDNASERKPTRRILNSNGNGKKHHPRLTITARDDARPFMRASLVQVRFTRARKWNRKTSVHDRRHVATRIWRKGGLWRTQRRALSIVADGDRLLNRAAINCRAISPAKLSQFPRCGRPSASIYAAVTPIREFRGINALIRMLLAPRVRLTESESKRQPAKVSRYRLSRATRADEITID